MKLSRRHIRLLASRYTCTHIYRIPIVKVAGPMSDDIISTLFDEAVDLFISG